MTTKLTYVAIAGAFCLAIVGTATSLSDADKGTVTVSSDKGAVKVSQDSGRKYAQGKSDPF